MAGNALKDACALTSPRKYTKDEVVELYRRAYEGDWVDSTL